MALWLRALVAALAEDLGSVPITYVAAHNRPTCSSTLYGHQAHTWSTQNMQAKHINLKEKLQNFPLHLIFLNRH